MFEVAWAPIGFESSNIEKRWNTWTDFLHFLPFLWQNFCAISYRLAAKRHLKHPKRNFKWGSTIWTSFSTLFLLKQNLVLNSRSFCISIIGLNLFLGWNGVCGRYWPSCSILCSTAISSRGGAFWLSGMATTGDNRWEPATTGENRRGMDKITSFRMEWRGMARNGSERQWTQQFGGLVTIPRWFRWLPRFLLVEVGVPACVCLYSLPRVAPPPRPPPLSLSLPTCRPLSFSTRCSPRFPSNIIIVGLPFLAGSHRLWPVLAIPPSKSPGPGHHKVLKSDIYGIIPWKSSSLFLRYPWARTFWWWNGKNRS